MARRSPIAVLLSLSLSVGCFTSQAQAPRPTTESFDQTFARLVPASSMALAVEPVYPRPSTATTLDALAKTYELTVTHDGPLTVLAPPTRRVFGMPRQEPIAAAELAQPAAFLALVSTLVETQLRALASRDGLSLSLLSSDEQRALFEAVVAPGGVPTIQSQKGTGLHPIGNTGTYSYTPPDTSRDWRTARLSYGEGARIFGVRLRQDQKGTTGVGSYPHNDLTMNAAEPDPANAYGRPVTTLVGNDPRPGALRVDEPWTKTAVPLDGVRTVADLLARVASASHHEIVADPRLGARGLAIVGRAAPAGDLLVATAHAFRATYRAVGPVLLLTDDALGLGSRASAWTRWEARGKAELDRLQNGYLAAAAARLLNVPKVGLGDDAPTDAQRERSRATRIGYVDLSVGELTDAQRSWLQAELAEPTNRGLYDETKAGLWPETRVIVRYAGLDDPVELTEVESAIPRTLPQPTTNEEPDLRKRTARGNAVALPLSLEALPDALDALHTVGTAEVWIVVASADLASPRLPQALVAARAKGLSPWVALRPFSLGSGEIPDVDLEGRPTDTVVPSPSATRVEAELLSRLKADGVVLLQPAPPGYRGTPERFAPDVPYGYTLPARLAFLRQTGYDPIDILHEPLPWRLREAFDSTAFGQVYNPPQEPRRTLERTREAVAEAALQAFRAAYSGPLRIESEVLPTVHEVVPWPVATSKPVLDALAGNQHPGALFRVVVPPGMSLAEASMLIPSGDQPFCLDLSLWKKGVASAIPGLFEGGKVP